MTRMRHFHLNINDSDNESDYAKLSKRKYVIGLVPFYFDTMKSHFAFLVILW